MYVGKHGWKYHRFMRDTYVNTCKHTCIHMQEVCATRAYKSDRSFLELHQFVYPYIYTERENNLYYTSFKHNEPS